MSRACHIHAQCSADLASFCRETAVRRRSNPSLTVGTPMASLKLRDFASEPRPLGNGLSHRDRVSRQKLANLPTLVGEDSRRRLYVTKTTLDWEVRGLTCPGTQHIQHQRNEIIDDGSDRSEERRVGKECRSRW